jgi:hypothetical protein
LLKVGKLASKILYLSYANLLKHMELAGPAYGVSDIYSKMCQLFEKALEEGNSVEYGGVMKQEDRVDLARVYMEYVLENCVSITQIKQIEQGLKNRNLYGS